MEIYLKINNTHINYKYKSVNTQCLTLRDARELSTLNIFQKIQKTPNKPHSNIIKN